MAGIVEFSVAAGGVLRVQEVNSLRLGYGSEEELVPASPDFRSAVDTAKETLESALGQVTPALGVITEKLRDALSPNAVTVEFGLVLGAETGIVIAKASGEVHFTVTLSWNKSDGGAGSASRQDVGG
jgi:hypothetical protein